jgi:hypothetical protein
MNKPKCDRCAYYPAMAQRPIKAGAIEEWMVVKAAGTIRQRLCADHVKAMKANGMTLIAVDGGEG